MMKLKKFEIFERDGFDDLDYYDDFHLRNNDEGYDRLNYGDENDDYDENEDDMQHLSYLLRSMFKNAGIDAEVTNSEFDIEITIMLKYKQSLDDIVNIFDIAKKLNGDILQGYSSTYEIWETRDLITMLTFVFNMDDDSDIPF